MTPVRARRRHRAPTPQFHVPTRSLLASPTRIAGTLAVAALGTLVAHFALSDAYYVYGASVSGNERVPAETVYDTSGLDGLSVFFVDPDAVSEQITALPDVKRAEVRIALPARAWIMIEETLPVLLWRGDGVTLAIDETGRAISPPTDTSALVEVRDESGALASPGAILPQTVVEAGSAYGSRFGPLAYHTAVGFVTTTPEGWEVRLGTDATVVEQQAIVLRALRARLIQERAAVEYIDLRFARRPYYRLRQEGN